MNQEIILALIAIVSGGGLTAAINAMISHSKNKRELRDKDIDNRIAAWQKISEKNEDRIGQLEKKVEICNRGCKAHERYILKLEQIILRADPPLELPERPDYEFENICTEI